MRRRAGDTIRMTRAQLDALDWTATRSSNVQAVAFEPVFREEGSSTGSLFVRFPGSVYRYDDVPADVHDALLEASQDPVLSVGQVLHQRVKPEYDCHPVRLFDDA